MFLLAGSIAFGETVPEEQAAGDLRTWAAVLEMVAVDYGNYPHSRDIHDVADYLEREGYWEEPVIYDPWGDSYNYVSNGVEFRVFIPGKDIGIKGSLGKKPGLGIGRNRPPGYDNRCYKAEKSGTADKSVTGMITMEKCEDCVIFHWTSGSPADIVGSTDEKFLNAYTLAADLSGTQWTYGGALVNGKKAEFFDISDDDGGNRGEDPNGCIPPVPPEITAISSAPFIGGNGTITGTNFSEVAGDNVICFDGGYCIQPDTATTTRLDFTVPPGALSGPVSAANGTLVSNTVDVEVQWEDPAYSDMIIRTLGFSESTGDFWGGVSDGGSKVYRLWYDDISGKWTREDRSGGFTDIHYCGTKTDRFGRLFCGKASFSSVSWATRYVATDPPGNLTPCLQISSGGDSTGENYIRKIAADCSGSLDSDYGNMNGAWNFDSLVGMSVDPANGDLYVSEKTAVYVVHTDESVELFKSGYTRVLGLDVWRKPGTDFGVLVTSDFSENNVKAVPLDNPSATPFTLASGSSMRAACFGYSTYDDTSWESANLFRLFVLHNDGYSMIPRREPFLMVGGSSDNGIPIWISSPDTLDLANHQSYVIYSYPFPDGLFDLPHKRDLVGRQRTPPPRCSRRRPQHCAL